MTRLERIAQDSLREKAASVLEKDLKHIGKVTEHGSDCQFGATVSMKAGSMPWINIPFSVWVG